MKDSHVHASGFFLVPTNGQRKIIDSIYCKSKMLFIWLTVINPNAIISKRQNTN